MNIKIAETNVGRSDSVDSMIRSGAIVEDDGVRILHISDTHFCKTRLGLKFARAFRVKGHDSEAWESLRVRARALDPKPDLVVVSGDISTFGNARALDFGRERLSELAQDVGLELSRFVCVPGNHDRFAGYVGWLFSWAMRRFERVFFDEFHCRSITLDSGTRLAIATFDSTEEGFRLWPLWANTGRVRAEGFLSFEKFYEKSCSEAHLIIAVLHHHPLPIPQTGIGSLTTMKNGGTFVKKMQESKVDLVLHGHKHKHYSCRINFGVSDDDTVVVAAGTACQSGRANGNPWSFSLVEHVPQRRALVKVFENQGQGFEQKPGRSTSFRLGG